jgi:putative transposase
VAGWTDWCITQIAAANTCRSATPNAWPRPARSPRWAPSGDSYDNALAETIIGLYKTELIRRRGAWKGIDEVEYATLEWVDWFNHRRLLEPIGYIPPAEFEATFQREESPSYPARLKQPSLR